MTALGNLVDVGVPISLGGLTLFAKKLKGAMFGDSNPSSDILRMLELYRPAS